MDDNFYINANNAPNQGYLNPKINNPNQFASNVANNHIPNYSKIKYILLFYFEYTFSNTVIKVVYN